MEFTLLVFALLIAGILFVRGPGHLDRRSVGLVAVSLGLVFAGWGFRALEGEDLIAVALPAPVRDGGFVSSSTCRSCHPGEYHSWHRSYHRTMTQPATPENVLGDFDNIELTDRGHAIRFERRGDEFWVNMTDPGFFSTSASARTVMPQVDTQIVMTTGSHHLQTYWVLRARDGEGAGSLDRGILLQIPWVWMVADRRWVPTQDSFLIPPRLEPMELLPWITSCNMCHSVGTQPRLAERLVGKSVELGIACEVCHGPGEAHVKANLSPLRRYQRHLDGVDAADPTIVNPSRLSKERSAEVCGQCHSFNKELDMARSKKTGVAYRAGDVLGVTKAVFKYTENPTHPRLLEHLRAEPTALAGRFWKDGTMRVAGREFNGLIESMCYTHGEMTCLSCHSMHGYDARKDQLAPDRVDDQSCLQCHADFAKNIEAHTFHRPDSVGSRCMNCHMPHTTFGLFVAMRSHRIDSPSAAVSAKTGRPNACNLCHLDRSLDWTAKTLTQWYGHGPVKLTDDQTKIASSVLLGTSGDGAQRAIIAWAMGWNSAQEASGIHWKAAFLSELLADPYSVTRQVAYRSIRTLPGFESFEFDYVAPRAQIELRVKAAIQTWRRVSSIRLDRHGPHLLLDPSGKFDVATHERLLKARDNSPVSIIE